LITAILLFRYSNEAFLDQLLRAQNKGNSRKENKQWDTRKLFGKLYYMFKPRKFFWIIVILMRKAMIAFTSLMFKKNPAFQLAMALFLMFTAYALQVLHRPYMSMVERPEVIRLAAERGELPAQNPEVILAKQIRAKRFKRTSLDDLDYTSKRKRDKSRESAAIYFFNYNTVESTLLGCGVLINLGKIIPRLVLFGLLLVFKVFFGECSHILHSSFFIFQRVSCFHRIDFKKRITKANVILLRIAPSL
jgi:hypothetical protein